MGKTGICAGQSPQPPDGAPIGSTNNNASGNAGREPASLWQAPDLPGPVIAAGITVVAGLYLCGLVRAAVWALTGF